MPFEISPYIREMPGYFRRMRERTPIAPRTWVDPALASIFITFCMAGCYLTSTSKEEQSEESIYFGMAALIVLNWIGIALLWHRGNMADAHYDEHRALHR